MIKSRKSIKRLAKRGRSYRMPNFITCFEERLVKEKERMNSRSYRSLCKTQELFLSLVSGRIVVKLDELKLHFAARLAYHVQQSGKRGRPLMPLTVKTYMGHYHIVFYGACKSHRVECASGFREWQYEVEQRKRAGIPSDAEAIWHDVEYRRLCHAKFLKSMSPLEVMKRLGAQILSTRMLDMPYINRILNK